MGMPKEVCDIKRRVVYKKVNVVFGEVINHKDYIHLPLAEGMEALSTETKKRMGELQKVDYLKK